MFTAWREFLSGAALLGWLAISAHATITPAPLFTDHAVLQRQQNVPVWGTAEPNEAIIIAIAGQTVRTTADNAGNWSLQLQPLQAGGPYSLSMSGSKSEMVTLQDVMMGQVWLCSGQSNMEYPLNGRSADAITKASIPTANDPLLRFAMLGHVLAATPQTRVSVRWETTTPITVPPLSAVAYYFARDLRARLNVPVGIIQSTYGGTYAQSWTSREALAAKPSLNYYLDADRIYATTTYPQLLKTYNDRLPEYQRKFEADKAAYEAAKQAGAPLPPPPRLPDKPQAPEQWQVSPNRLYNGMIAPLILYAIKGALWYQGESNWNSGYEYKTLLPTLIADWRGRWKQGDFPFYIVQLPPFQGVNPNPAESWWAEMREAQRLTALSIPNTGLVVTTDVGDAKAVHPLRKEPIGQRLALLARAKTYGENIEFSGPTLKSVEIKGNQVRVNFDHAAGLKSAQINDNKMEGPIVASSNQVLGFTLAAADGKFFNAAAKIEGTTILLSAPEVTAPVSVRYGWSQYPLANLQNGAGLWASPFETGINHWMSQPKLPPA